MTTADRQNIMGGVVVSIAVIGIGTFFGYQVWKMGQPMDATWPCSNSEYNALLRHVQNGELTETDITAETKPGGVIYKPSLRRLEAIAEKNQEKQTAKEFWTKLDEESEIQEKRLIEKLEELRKAREDRQYNSIWPPEKP